MAGSSLAEFEALRVGDGAHFPLSHSGGVGETRRVAGDPNAFAITVVGDSMWPRFRPGRHVAVSPRSPISIGDDVLLRLKGEGTSVLLKELVRQSRNQLELRQFNPDTTFTVEADEIEAIYKVAGEVI